MLCMSGYSDIRHATRLPPCHRDYRASATMWLFLLVKRPRVVRSRLRVGEVRATQLPGSDVGTVKCKLLSGTMNRLYVSCVTGQILNEALTSSNPYEADSTLLFVCRAKSTSRRFDMDATRSMKGALSHSAQRKVFESKCASVKPGLRRPSVVAYMGASRTYNLVQRVSCCVAKQTLISNTRTNW